MQIKRWTYKGKHTKKARKLKIFEKRMAGADDAYNLMVREFTERMKRPYRRIATSKYGASAYLRFTEAASQPRYYEADTRSFLYMIDS